MVSQAIKTIRSKTINNEFEMPYQQVFLLVDVL
jgi:hypothetical protein